MKKVLYKIFIFIAILLIVINIITTFNLSLLGFRIYRVGSGSMVPYLNINDIIVIKKQKNYELNDVVTYRNNDNEYITHRIIKKTDTKIVTKGDANNIEDDPISIDNVIGKVIFKITNIGFILLSFNKPLIWILLFIIGMTITIFIPDKKKK